MKILVQERSAWQYSAPDIPRSYRHFHDHQSLPHKCGIVTLVIDLLGPALKGNKIDQFELFRNNFSDAREGIEFAVDRIKDNRNVSRFMWSSNRIDSIEDVNYLVEAIVTHPSITTIRLDHSFGEYINGHDVLRTLLTCGKTFSMIQMSGNNARTGGSTLLLLSCEQSSTGGAVLDKKWFE